MFKVAIVGNIASGKSTLEQILKDKGFEVYDTDKISHQVLRDSKEILELFGTIDRKKIAEIVFSDKKKLELLESIIHPKVKEELLKIFNSDSELIFVSVPQLFESKMETLFDKIIYITSDINIRKQRLMARNSLTEQEAEKRINAQSEENKAKLSDFVIENNSTIENLKLQLESILETIL